MIRSELAEQNLGLNLNSQSLSDILRYVCHSQNLFSHAHGSDRTPKELASGSKLREPTFAPFWPGFLPRSLTVSRRSILWLRGSLMRSTLHLFGTQLVVRSLENYQPMERFGCVRFHAKSINISFLSLGQRNSIKTCINLLSENMSMGAYLNHHRKCCQLRTHL